MPSLRPPSLYAIRFSPSANLWHPWRGNSSRYSFFAVLPVASINSSFSGTDPPPSPPLWFSSICRFLPRQKWHDKCLWPGPRELENRRTGDRIELTDPRGQEPPHVQPAPFVVQFNLLSKVRSWKNILIWPAEAKERIPQTRRKGCSLGSLSLFMWHEVAKVSCRALNSFRLGKLNAQWYTRRNLHKVLGLYCLVNRTFRVFRDLCTSFLSLHLLFWSTLWMNSKSNCCAQSSGCRSVRRSSLI